MSKLNTKWTKILLIVSMFIAAPLIKTQMSSAHQIALFDIKGKNHLFEVEWANEPVSVDDKTNLEFTAVLPNATDPTNADANGTIPITGLDSSLKMEISAGNKTMVSDLDPSEDGKPGVYESKTFYPTIPTTYNFKIFGTVNGTNFDSKDTFGCNPTTGEDTPPNNATVQMSNDVVRKNLHGGLDCPDERVGFPEPYVSQHDLSEQINKTSSK